MIQGLSDLVDRGEIVDVVHRLSVALDGRERAAWERLFVDDALVDFSSAGIAPCGPSRLWEILTAHDDRRIDGQHLLGNHLVVVGGPDRSRARTEYSMTGLARTEAVGVARRTQGAGWYEDELHRTPDGWRIGRRVAHLRWFIADEVPWPPS